MRYSYATKRGTFHIVSRVDRWHVMYDDEDLGSYHSPEAAADDLSGGHTFAPSNGVDPATLDIPASILEWTVER